jgi:polyribonucleotide nucleotidyltransferase
VCTNSGRFILGSEAVIIVLESEDTSDRNVTAILLAVAAYSLSRQNHKQIGSTIEHSVIRGMNLENSATLKTPTVDVTAADG